jgi:hypothetical protein
MGGSHLTDETSPRRIMTVKELKKLLAIFPESATVHVAARPDRDGDTELIGPAEIIGLHPTQDEGAGIDWICLERGFC